MNSEEVQYALDRRNEVDLPWADPATDNIFYEPIQLGHLTGDVVIKSSQWANINYLGPPGRAVFEYDYTGAQTPPRLFFQNVVSRNRGVGTYNVENVSFLRVIQPNTSPKAMFFDHCDLFNTGSYLIDGPDVSGCDGIQIKHCTGGGSGLIRWKLRHDATMLFLEINNKRYQTSGRVGPSTDLKNTRGIYFLVYTDEQNTDLIEPLRNEYVGPLSHRFVNPRGFNSFEHNWNEYTTNMAVEAPGCWATSIRVDDVSGDYGMHYIRRYQTPFRHITSSGVSGVQMYGGHSDTNAASLFVERLEAFNTGAFEAGDAPAFGGKLFPKVTDGMDLFDEIATLYSDLNAGGVVSRLEVYEADGQPRLYGNTRDPYYNTSYRLARKGIEKDFETVLNEQAQVAYGGKNSIMTFDGSDIVIKFVGNDTLVVTEEIEVYYLIQGAGASGGCRNDSSLEGGGGGAGGHESNYPGGPLMTLAAGSYPVVVGVGGVFEWGTFGTGVDGTASSFNGISKAGGGGGGGSEDNVTFTDGNPGACGGGAASQGGTVGGAATDGYAGGSSDEASGGSGGSGGGGVGGVGGNGYLDGGQRGGNGGPGVQNSITGTAEWYGEGGGGGTNNTFQGEGGVAGGGWPKKTDETGFERDGKANSGSGGGGGANASGAIVNYPGNGADGVVIIRIPVGV